MERLAAIKKLKQYYSVPSLINLSDYDIESVKIPTYVINLPSRPERLSHIMNQFRDKSEFDLHITQAYKHERGATGLWQSICSIVKTAVLNDDDVIIIVEDDHVFTEHYDRNILITNIILAGSQGADILCGGISGGFHYAIPITQHRYWINYFWGTQFIIIYKKMFELILNAEFGITDTADDFLSSLTVNKMVLFPFISVQRDFGYSDITLNNEERGDLSKIFTSTEKKLAIYGSAYRKYIINSSLSS
jgi:glycosyl transferase family 25